MQVLCRFANSGRTLLLLGKQLFLPVFFWNKPAMSFICVCFFSCLLKMFAAPFASWWYAMSLFFAHHWAASTVMSINSSASSGSAKSSTLLLETPFMSWTFSIVLGTTWTRSFASSKSAFSFCLHVTGKLTCLFQCRWA